MDYFNVSDSTNWSFVWEQDFSAPSSPGNVPELDRYFPLAPVSVPIELQSNLLAFYASSSSANSSWKASAYVKRKFLMGISSEGDNTAIVGNNRIFLNQFSLIQYPKDFESSYSLVISFPYWIRDISLKLWQYKSVSPDIILLLQGTNSTSTEIKDKSLLRNPITLHGDVRLSTNQSKITNGNSLSFDGSGDYLSLNYNDNFDLSNKDFTIEGWFNSNSFSSPQVILSKDTFGLNWDWGIRIVSASTIEILSNRGFTNLTVNIPPLSTGTWYHFALVRIAGVNYFYLNGISYGANTMGISNDSRDKITVGCHSHNNPSAFFNGYLDRISIRTVGRYSTNFVPNYEDIF